jgi:hypothetical protein
VLGARIGGISEVDYTLDAAMTDEEYLQAQREARAESVKYFGVANKPEREKWVAQTFLVNLGINHNAIELVAGEDPPDVQFRDARFEIKEILDPDRRRHQEYKDSLEEANRATTPRDLVRPAPFNEIAIAKVYELVLQNTEELSKNRYALALRRKLDLLFYVNLLNVYEFIEVPFPSVSALSSLGWKSVSFVKGHRSCVLTAAKDAPNFLRNNIGRVMHRKPKNEAASNL